MTPSSLSSGQPNQVSATEHAPEAKRAVDSGRGCRARAKHHELATGSVVLRHRPRHYLLGQTSAPVRRLGYHLRSRPVCENANIRKQKMKFLSQTVQKIESRGLLVGTRMSRVAACGEQQMRPGEQQTSAHAAASGQSELHRRGRSHGAKEPNSRAVDVITDACMADHCARVL